MLKVGELVPNPRNPRNHPEDQITGLVASIRKFGQPEPILVRAENHMIVAGHGVWTACRRAGLRQVEVDLWDVDQAMADHYTG